MKVERWTKEEEEELASLINENKSIGQIARHFKLSKGSIAGKASRMGLKFKYRVKRQKQQLQGRSKKYCFGRSYKIFPEQTTPYQFKDHQPLKNSKPVPLEDLKNNQCSFPFGTKTPYLFCGIRKKDNSKSYCEHHMSLAYVVGSADNPY